MIRVAKALRLDVDSGALRARHELPGSPVQAARIYAGTGVPVVLARSLWADNVANTIAAVQPYGVDVISGVERLVGHKDPGKVRAFLRASSPWPPEWTPTPSLSPAASSPGTRHTWWVTC